MMLSDVCLSVCLASVAYIGSKSRTERPRKIQIGIEVVTRDSDTPLSSSKCVANTTNQPQILATDTLLGCPVVQKVIGQGHQAAILAVALTHHARAAVTAISRTYWARETTATLRLLGGA